MTQVELKIPFRASRTLDTNKNHNLSVKEAMAASPAELARLLCTLLEKGTPAKEVALFMNQLSGKNGADGHDKARESIKKFAEIAPADSFRDKFFSEIKGYAWMDGIRLSVSQQDQTPLPIMSQDAWTRRQVLSQETAPDALSATTPVTALIGTDSRPKNGTKVPGVVTSFKPNSANQKKQLALTFDLCPPGENVASGKYFNHALVAHMLNKNIAATFFVNKQWWDAHKKSNPDAIRLLEDGARQGLFQLANHGVAHKPLSAAGG